MDPKPVMATTVSAGRSASSSSRSMPQSARLRKPGASITRSTPSRSSESDAAAAGRHLDDGTPLVRVQVGEHPRVGTERVALGWFHLHHVGAEIRERLAAPSRGHAGSDLDDPQVAQCLSHDVPSPIRISAPACREPAEDRIRRLPAHDLVDGAPQQLAIVAHGVEQASGRARSATSRMPSCRHVVPEPAVRIRRAKP